MPMPAMAMMHEEVHQRARKKQEKWQGAEQMGGMFSHEVEAGDCQKPE
jgi:hypothetical protein